MDGAVKMPGPQIQVNTANRVQSTQNSDSGIEFIRLMQAKNDQTKTTGQEKTLQKTENKTSQSTNDVKENPTNESGKEPEISSDKETIEEITDAEEMAQQAAMQQTAALLAGMIAQSPEGNAEESVMQEDVVSAVGELLTEEVPVEAVGAEMAEAGQVQTDALAAIAEAQAEVKTEVVAQTAVQETAGKPEAAQAQDAPTEAVQTEAAQPKAVEETIKNEGKATGEKAEKAEDTEKVNEPVRNVSGEQKAEEKPETGKQTAQEEFAGQGSRKAEETLNHAAEGENGQVQAAGAESFRVFGQQNQNSLFGQKAETVSMKTSPETIPQDLGKMLGAKMAEGARTLTLELEPANLGKLTIHLSYEGDRAAVSIMATNPKTLELLNQKASEIAAILEEKTGQETVIFTQKPETNQENYDRNPDGKREREEQEEKHQQNKEEHQSFDSFAQQLRLGLV
jgi:flagellar hook-length control protein FliK